MALAMAAFACDDIIEDDITDDVVQVVSPLEGAEIESNVVNFQWNQLSGADEYRLQVYGENQIVAIDSMVTGTRFTCPLAAGHYQWRVRGENSAYQSSYSFPMGFTLIESDNLDNQQVILSSPDNGIYTNNSTRLCSWQTLNAAESYTFQLNNLTAGGLVFEQENITGSTLTLNNTQLSQDGEYQWKVKAVNTTSSTEFASRNFFLDTNVPAASVNSLPANNSNQTINVQLSFSWSVPADTGVIQSPVTYTIEFSNTAAFTSITSTQTNLITPSHQQTFTVSGDYFWRVKTKDKATNESLYSAPFKFTIP